MAPIYNFKDIEAKWQKIWDDKKSFATPRPTAGKPPYFMLVMFPYPSGNLHMGHVRNYTIGDILARFHRRQNRSVLHPIGWDAFGLPAENAAIKNNVAPAKWTWENIANMRGQLKSLAISYDWDREVATCDPKYYRWNQWIFIKMYEKGLAYRRKAPVNWCNSCLTVLANEQVHDGRCWRCDNLVVQKELEQWFFKITDYAEELLQGHAQLRKTATQKGWPEQVLTMQSHWIGRSKGAHVDFTVLDGNRKKTNKTLRVFTTRPDTLYGATFMVVAPEHALVDEIVTPDRRAAVSAYRDASRRMTRIDRTAENREKTGEFTGAYAENPVNGKAIPIWTADYVLTDYGTGAIMAVPAHDQRDFDFAKKFGIDVIQVIQPVDKPITLPLTEAYEGDGVMIDSGELNGLAMAAAVEKIIASLEAKSIGKGAITYKLRDWLLSRQRYWGTPIPVLYCESCGIVPEKLENLPVTLPENVVFTGVGASPLTQATDWINAPCPTCGKPARRETDTMDTFVDSSWYYARYTDAHNDQMPFAPEKANQWLPVHQYVGGVEHATMHLIYSRFFHKVFRDLGLVKSDEPFASLLTQGMVTLGGTAMSKSKGNVVDPTDVIAKFGTDTCRLFILFAAPPTQQLEWSDKQVEGVWRFLNRVWRLGQIFFDEKDATAPKRSLDESVKTIEPAELTHQTHVTIQRVTHDIAEDFGFNTAIAIIMELVNSLYRYANLGDGVSREAVETILQLLNPFAPHMTEEIWRLMGHSTMLSEAPWPTPDPEKLAVSSVQIVIQVNGKLRDKVSVATGATEEAILSLALAALQKRGIAVSPQKVIYVPNKLVNFVDSKN